MERLSKTTWRGHKTKGWSSNLKKKGDETLHCQGIGRSINEDLKEKEDVTGKYNHWKSNSGWLVEGHIFFQSVVSVLLTL